jgi:hypothetical protein
MKFSQHKFGSSGLSTSLAETVKAAVLCKNCGEQGSSGADEPPTPCDYFLI